LDFWLIGWLIGRQVLSAMAMIFSWTLIDINKAHGRYYFVIGIVEKIIRKIEQATILLISLLNQEAIRLVFNVHR
jgi:hypothetical protein